MYPLRTRWLLFSLLPSALLLLAACGRQENRISIENGVLRLGFDRGSGALVSLVDQNSGHEFLDSNVHNQPPWELFIQESSSLEQVGCAVCSFSWSKVSRGTLEMRWENFGASERNKLRVAVRVELNASEPLSYWSIAIEGLENQRLAQVDFPVIEGISAPEGAGLAVPTWTGQLIRNPGQVLSARSDRAMRWMYPGYLSMQLAALYDSTGCGFYAAADDTLSYAKEFVFSAGRPGALDFRIAHYPPLDSLTSTYSPAYRAVIGSFRGDWMTVAERYRTWAEQQWWCRDSRLRRGLTPGWLDSTALWVWNRKESADVLVPAIELKKALGLPVSVFWHWWHGCAYDDNFPEYFPPREGAEAFRNAVAKAEGSDIRSVLYMNSIQWGNSSAGFGSEEVRRNTVKDRSGQPHSHVYNLFTGTALTMMCVGTDFWRNTYAALCDTAASGYSVSGIYMDQACLSRLCYDPDHGHTPGGGNYWFENYAGLTRQIRSATSGPEGPVLAGEGTGENWLPFLDAMLALQLSRERYSGVDGIETIPFFQAVYHPYGITYGNYSSLLYPPYDDLWPEEYAPEQEHATLGAEFGKQFLMEQARSFVWGQQPTIANYQDFLLIERPEEMRFLFDLVRLRMRILKYLLHGEFCRSPAFPIPEEEIDISRLSIYAGKTGNVLTAFRKTVPAIYHGTWKAADGSIGIAIASISDCELPVELDFLSADYGLPPAGNILLHTIAGIDAVGGYSDGRIKLALALPPRSVLLLEVSPD
jgi:hypothetical protein